MANIELVIKIPEEMYEKIKETNMIISGRRSGKRFDYILFNAITNGTVLPKGHGRLIDGSKLKVELECGIRAGNYERGYDRYAHINSMDDCVDAVEYADTVIKADAESEEV